MKKRQRHIIQRQTFILNIQDESQHYEVGEQVKKLFQSQVLDKLSNLFDEIAGGQHIQIDQLVVEIPSLKLAELPSQFSALLLEKLEQEIRQLLPQIEEGVEDEEALIQKKGKDERMLQAFGYFCQFGTFPWWFEDEGPKKLEKDLRELKTDNILKVLQKLPTSSDISKRLLFQFSEPFILMLIKASAEIHPLPFLQTLEEWEGIIQRGKFPQLSSIKIKQLLQSLYIETYLLESKQYQDEGVFLANLIANITQITRLNTVDVALQLYSGVTSEENSQETSHPLKEAITGWIQRQVQEENAEHSDDVVGNKNNTPIQSKQSDKGIPFSKPQKPKKPQKLYYIKNAGLVLLWPYLARFFEAVGLVENGKFKDEIAQRRCLLLLQYLADGKHEWGEPELLLNKIMCAYPIWQTVENQIDISETEKEQSEILLKAVIRNWPILKTTSVSGLQHNFLQREGKLEDKDTFWKLSVERATLDIVVDQIPWSFRTVKFPWMEKIIRVEW